MEKIFKPFCCLVFALLCPFLFLTACVPGETGNEGLSSDDFYVNPSQVAIKPSGQVSLVIHGGVGPFSAVSTNENLGTAYLPPGLDSRVILVTANDFNQLGTFNVRVTDHEGRTTVSAIDVLDGFQVAPKERQIYPGRRSQIEILGGGEPPYQYRLKEGAEYGQVDENGLVAINHDIDNKTLVVEVEDARGVKELAVFNIRKSLISDSITMALGRNHTCLGHKNNTDSATNLQCWGNMLSGALGYSRGLYTSLNQRASTLTPTKVGTGLATKVYMGEQSACVTFSTSALTAQEAYSISCWGSGEEADLANAGIYPDTMDYALSKHSFKDENGSSLFIKKLAQGGRFYCALLGSNTNLAADGEVRCWGSAGWHTNLSNNGNKIGALGTNSNRYIKLSTVANQVTSDYKMDWKSGYTVRGFPHYVHYISQSLANNIYNSADADAGGVTSALTYQAGSTKILATLVGAGNDHACAVEKGSNHILCWGKNRNHSVSPSDSDNIGGNIMFKNPDGSLGNILSNDVSTFAPPVTPESLLLGRAHSCFIGNNQIYCWGANSRYQSNPNTNSRADVLSPVPGYSAPPLTPVNLKNSTSSVDLTVLSGSAGDEHTCVIVKDDGTDVANIAPNQGRVICFGRHYEGQLGTGGGNFNPNASGNFSYVELGDILSGGVRRPYQARKVVAFGNSTCALLESSSASTPNVGKVKCWGENYYNQLGYGDIDQHPSANTDVFSISANEVVDINAFAKSVCALKANSELICWGDLKGGKLGQENLINAHSNLDEPFSNVEFTNLNTVQEEIASLSASNQRSCAVFKSGYAKCWGDKGRNALGVNTSTDVGSLPNQIGTGSSDLVSTYDVSNYGVSQVVHSGGNGCAINLKQQVVCWGPDYTGGNANESFGDVSRYLGTPPAPALQNKKAQKISAGSNFFCGLFLNASGQQEVTCWGSNGNGQLGNTSNTSLVGGPSSEEYNDNATPLDGFKVPLGLTAQQRILDLQSGSSYSCILISNGGPNTKNTVRCWGNVNMIGVGYNNDPVIPSVTSSERYAGSNFVTPDLPFKEEENPIQLALASNFACVLMDTEDVKCWGEAWHTSGRGVDYRWNEYLSFGRGNKVVKLYSGSHAQHLCAVFADQPDDKDNRPDIRCFGQNQSGQLGIGSQDPIWYNTDYLTPYSSKKIPLLLYKKE